MAEDVNRGKRGREGDDHFRRAKMPSYSQRRRTLHSKYPVALPPSEKRTSLCDLPKQCPHVLGRISPPSWSMCFCDTLLPKAALAEITGINLITTWKRSTKQLPYKAIQLRLALPRRLLHCISNSLLGRHPLLRPVSFSRASLQSQADGSLWHLQACIWWRYQNEQ